jgi:hypothetical protein
LLISTSKLCRSDFLFVVDLCFMKEMKKVPRLLP